jgi:hypothetical protein
MNRRPLLSIAGEAQIAVVDLLGMMTGILLSRAIGPSRLRIGTAYLLLSSVDLFTIYKEIRSVVFKDLNFERLSLILEDYVGGGGASAVLSPSAVAARERIFRNPASPR